MTGEEDRPPVSAQDFRDAMLHVIELLKGVSGSYVLMAMPDNEELGPLLDFHGNMDEMLSMLSRSEAMLHSEALKGMTPNIETRPQKPDQMRRPEVG